MDTEKKNLKNLLSVKKQGMKWDIYYICINIYVHVHGYMDMSTVCI